MAENSPRILNPRRISAGLAILVVIGGIAVGVVAIRRELAIRAFVEAISTRHTDEARECADSLRDHGWLAAGLRRAFPDPPSLAVRVDVAKLGSVVVPALAELTSASEPDALRLEAVVTLYLIATEGGDLSEARGALLRLAADDPSPLVRGTAILAYGHAWFGGPDVPASFVAALDDADVDLRLKAAEAIALIDPSRADVALPVLIALLGAADDEIARAAAVTIGYFREHGLPAAPALRGVLDRKESVVQAAIASLGLIRDGSPETLAILREQLRRGEIAAAVALGDIGPAAAPAIPDLIEAARGEDRELAVYARYALFDIDRRAAIDAGLDRGDVE